MKVSTQIVSMVCLVNRNTVCVHGRGETVVPWQSLFEGNIFVGLLFVSVNTAGLNGDNVWETQVEFVGFISPSSSVATWTLTPPEDATGWRHIRLKINGPNASGQTHYLSVSGLELYGEVRGLADDDLGESVYKPVAVVL